VFFRNSFRVHRIFAATCQNVATGATTAGIDLESVE
jgi:hypothetical protein